MTKSAYTVSPADRKRLSHALANPASAPLIVQTADGAVELPAEAAEAVRHLLTELASGAVVHVFADDAELTTQ